MPQQTRFRSKRSVRTFPALESMDIEVDYDQSEENAAGREARQEAGKYEKLRDQLDKVKDK